MKEEKKESPIGVLWGWGKPYHGKFIGSVILAVLGVACQMVPYFCVAHIVTLMLSGEQELMDDKPVDPSKLRMNAVQCPNCGASYQAAAGYTGRCPYCGSYHNVE